jgi:hypothetical protein
VAKVTEHHACEYAFVRVSTQVSQQELKKKMYDENGECLFMAEEKIRPCCVGLMTG